VKKYLTLFDSRFTDLTNKSTFMADKKQKIKEELEYKLNEALLNLRSTDIIFRKKGVKHLSDRSRFGVGDHRSIVVSNWFLEKENRREIFDIIKREADESLVGELLHTLYWSCFLRAGWEQKYSSLPDAEVYKKEVQSFVEGFVDSKSPLILSGVAGLLAFFQDSRAWDAFHIVLQKEKDYLTLARFRYAHDHNDGNNFISEKQAERLKEVLMQIDIKTKNKEVKSVTTDMLNKL
jgi:hypothetical protein